MTSIISLLDKYPEPINRTIDLTIEQMSSTGVRYQRGLPDPALQRFMPIARYAAAKLALQKIKERRPTIAYIVGVDGEIPRRREPLELSMETIGSAKLARGAVYTESDFDLLREAEMYLANNNPEIYAAFTEQYLQAPARLTQSIMILASALLTQIYTSGACTYVDAETKLGYELSYLTQVPSAHRPAALSGNALWSAAATATPLPNLATHLNNFYDSMFMMPEAIVMSSTAANAMLNANDTKDKIGRLQGRLTTSTDPSSALGTMPRPTIQECRDWLAREVTTAAQGSVSVPEIIVSDGVYFTYTAAGAINDTAVRFFPADTYFFAEENAVEGAFVPTATNNYAQQFAFVTEEISRSPRRESASIDTRFLALVPDPRKLGWRKVL